jgi:hypothetical protein
MTQKLLDLYINLRGTIEQEANSIIQIYQKIRKEILDESPKNLYFENIDGNTLRYTGTDYWAFGGFENNELNLPLSYLNDPNWEIGIRDRALYDKSLKIQIKNKDKERMIEREKETLRKLKEKYPDI